ncbi:MAG: CDP-diacylglycerol--glycerol-3-phosphate 3-phosphatidyltransferase [Bacteroidota bacterium]
MISISLPNQLTLLRILLTPVFVSLLFSQDHRLRQLAFVAFTVASMTDWYDGWVARKWGYISRWGKFFDPLADKVLTSAAFFAFAVLGLAQYWMVWIIVIRDILITLLRSLAEYKDQTVVTTYFAKVKTFAQMTLIYYILILHLAKTTPGFWSDHQVLFDMLLNPTLVYILMLIITIITLWTGITYIIDNRKTILNLYVSRSRITESD